MSRKVVTVIKRSPYKAEIIDAYKSSTYLMLRLLGRDRITHLKDP